nr:unnamed protein product [Spirometra erinaceieuropaei]
MDDERLPKRLFYGDVATGSRRRGGQIRNYKDTLKSSLKRLQINPTNWEELALDRPTWRKKVKTGAAIYEANRIAAVKAKREARKSQLRPVLNAAAQPLPTCPRCQRTFRARIGLVGHLQTNWASRKAPTIVPSPASSSSSPPPTNSAYSSDPPLPSSSSSYSSSPTAPTAAAQATVPRTTTDITATSPDSIAEDQDYTCPHCDRTFASHIGLVGHLRIHRTETGEPEGENCLRHVVSVMAAHARLGVSVTGIWLGLPGARYDGTTVSVDHEEKLQVAELGSGIAHRQQSPSLLPPSPSATPITELASARMRALTAKAD